VEAPIIAYLETTGPELVDRFNEEFSDAVLFVAQSLGGFPEASSAQVVAIDPGGIDSLVTDPTGDHVARIEFGIEVRVPDHLTEALFELLERARTASGAEGQTSAEREMAGLASIGTHLTQVVAVTDVHPHLRQITFGGGDLATTFSPLGPDCFFYVLLPPPGRTELGIDQSFTWEAHALMPPEDQPVGAYYTLRRWRPEVAELDIWVVLHGHGDDTGPASEWASRAQVGDRVALWGPRTSFHPPEGTDHLLLVADETGLPAMAGVIEWLPDGMPATVIAEVADDAEHQELPERPGVEVIWRHRDGAPAGTTTSLVDAVRELPSFEGTPYVFGAGEAKAMTAVRRHVRDERGLDRDAVALIAYWRHRSTRETEVDPEV
jgi:NADPH-dependent ferric siderophore reductase